MGVIVFVCTIMLIAMLGFYTKVLVDKLDDVRGCIIDVESELEKLNGKET